jgi:hypothetical protein
LDTRLQLIAKCCPRTPAMLAMMVLARAIDRNVQDAIKTFGPTETLKLVTFFRLSFDHFRQLLHRLSAELPSDDERAWQFLGCQSFTGNTPFEADRYYPLAEIYPYSLAQKISAELQNAKKNGRLAYVPTSRSDFGKGTFAFPEWEPLPDNIHEAVRKADYPAAIKASQSVLTSRSENPAQAARIADYFSHSALMAYDPVTARCALVPPESEVPHVLAEAARLFSLAYEQAEGVQKARCGINYLRFLLTPQRPKARAERGLARRLYRVADTFYRRSGRAGSSMYLLGCLKWLEGDGKRAVRAFLRAAKCGRASCDEYDWIWLLRYAPLVARKNSKSALNKFLKLSELEGVLYREPSPRTNLLEKELRHHTNAAEFEITVKPFP